MGSKSELLIGPGGSERPSTKSQKESNHLLETRYLQFDDRLVGFLISWMKQKTRDTKGSWVS